MIIVNCVSIPISRLLTVGSMPVFFSMSLNSVLGPSIVGAFSVIVIIKTDGSFASLILTSLLGCRQDLAGVLPVPLPGRGGPDAGHGVRAPDPPHRGAGQHAAPRQEADPHVLRHLPQGDPDASQVGQSLKIIFFSKYFKHYSK